PVKREHAASVQTSPRPLQRSEAMKNAARGAFWGGGSATRGVPPEIRGILAEPPSCPNPLRSRLLRRCIWPHQGGSATLLRCGCLPAHKRPPASCSHVFRPLLGERGAYPQFSAPAPYAHGAQSVGREPLFTVDPAVVDVDDAVAIGRGAGVVSHHDHRPLA